MPEDYSVKTIHLISDIAEFELGNQSDTHQTQKTKWLALGKSLVAEGIEPKRVRVTATELIEKKMNELNRKKGIKEPARFINGWFRKIYSEKGWTDLDYARTTVPDKALENSSYIGEKEKKTRVNVNHEWLSKMYDWADLCDYISTRIRELRDAKGKPIDLSKTVSKKTKDAFFHESEAIRKIVKAAADEKTKIPPHAHSIFKNMLRVHSGLPKIAEAFLETKLKMLKKHSNFLTAKQAGKFKKGEEPNMLEIYKPKLRDEAIFAGWVGVRCDKCLSWRVRINTDGSAVTNYSCLDCDNTIKRKTIFECKKCRMELYDDDIVYIKETGKCPGCDTKIRIPEGFQG